MRTSQRTSRLLTAVLSLVLLVGLVTPALADPATAEFTGAGKGMQVTGDLGGDSLTLGAHEMRMVIDGEATFGFCIDINTMISPGTELTEESWSDSGIANLDKVAWILGAYESTTDENAAATQAAIWHLTDGFDLTGPAAVKDRYDAILASVGSIEEPSLGLEVTPAEQSGSVGETLSFDVATTATDWAVDADDPVTVTERTDGSGFDVTTSEVVENATVTVTTSTDVQVPAGRVFARPHTQRLILAETTTTSLDATEQVTVSFSWRVGTPVAPTVTPSSTCDVQGTLEVPDTTGVVYLLDGTDVSGETLTGPLSGTLTARAAEDYRLTDPDWTFPFDILAAADCVEVAPEAPRFVDPTCASDTVRVVLPEQEGIEWTVEGDQVPGATVTVTAASTGDPYVLPADADREWTHEFGPVRRDCAPPPPPPSDEVVDPLAPSFVDPTCAASTVQVVLPEVTGVTYEVDGEQAPGATVEVTAVAEDGFAFDDDAVTTWSHTFDEVPTDCDEVEVDDDVVVRPSPPSFSGPTCDDEGVTVGLPEVDGVTYAIDGDVEPGGSVLVVATPDEGHTFPVEAVTQWQHVFPTVASLDCEPDPGQTTDVLPTTVQQPAPDPAPQLPATGLNVWQLALLALLLGGAGARLQAVTRPRQD